jgi:hypothetical protein
MIQCATDTNWYFGGLRLGGGSRLRLARRSWREADSAPVRPGTRRAGSLADGGPFTRTTPRVGLDGHGTAEPPVQELAVVGKFLTHRT